MRLTLFVTRFDLTNAYGLAVCHMLEWNNKPVPLLRVRRWIARAKSRGWQVDVMVNPYIETGTLDD